MNVTIKKVNSKNDLQACLTIRKRVFVLGQKVPITEELDGKDGESLHYLLSVDEKPSGVARVRISNNFAKIERVAVLPQHQRKGLGLQLMQRILMDIKQQNTNLIAKLSA